MRLSHVLRQLLLSVNSSYTIDPPKAASQPMQVLEDMVDVVAAELNKRLREASATATRVSELEARLQQKVEEAAMMQQTMR